MLGRVLFFLHEDCMEKNKTKESPHDLSHKFKQEAGPICASSGGDSFPSSSGVN